ncbi:MAG: ankyrin repeat domain-containing protein [Thermodesulfobacteriota bacterium]|nr:ankyrin repeat domain-containing protein [Thermodesulfobacteriota bacterium]
MNDQPDKTIEAVLASASDRLFPEAGGEARVTLDSRSPDGDSALHVFIWGNETENALFLIKSGIDINVAGDMGETPLHAALHQHNSAVIKALLDAGARTDIVSEFGKTAVDLAKEQSIDLAAIR